MIWMFHMILIWIYLLNFNEISLNKKLRMMSGKNPWKNNMILSWRMGCESWWDLHLEPNQLVVSGSSKPSTNNMSHLKRTHQGLWKKHLHRNKVLIMRWISPQEQNVLPFILNISWELRMKENFIKWMWIPLHWMETWKRMSSCLS